MENGNLPSKTFSQQLTRLSSGEILKVQPEKEVLSHLCVLIERLVKLFQIQGWDTNGTIILAEWILDNYKYESLELVTKVLTNPPKTSKPSWRLTPDTINEWMGIELEKLAERREIEAHNSKHETVENEWTDERLKEFEQIVGHETKKIAPLSEEDIRREGKERMDGYRVPDREYYILNQLKIKYGIECCDKYTGKVLPGMPEFSEWIKTQ